MLFDQWTIERYGLGSFTIRDSNNMVLFRSALASSSDSAKRDDMLAKTRLAASGPQLLALLVEVMARISSNTIPTQVEIDRLSSYSDDESKAKLREMLAFINELRATYTQATGKHLE